MITHINNIFQFLDKHIFRLFSELFSNNGQKTKTVTVKNHEELKNMFFTPSLEEQNVTETAKEAKQYLKN